MIRHVILYKFYNSTTKAQRQEALSMLASLGKKIPEICEWSIGVQVRSSQKAFDVAQVSSFDDLDALDRFRRHSEHIRIREFLSTIADWEVVDYEYEI